MEKWLHEFRQVNGIRLHYVTAGTGPLVILLHGFPEFWYSWRNQLPELSKHYKVVAPDLRGFGDSDKPKGVKNYTTKVIAKDIQELILSFGETKANIVAHDWGGAAGWNFAQRFPEHLDKLVVINCPLPAVLQKHLLSNFSQLKKSWYMFFFQLPWIPERYISKDLTMFFKRALRGWSRNKKSFSNEDIAKYVKAFEKPYAITAAINYYRAGFRYAWDKSVTCETKINADTLMIWGEDDKALGKELTYDMEKYFNNHFEIRYIKDCSHWVQHDYPGLVNQYILEFLEAKI